jgi:ABC-2 type transport system permease protein
MTAPAAPPPAQPAPLPPSSAGPPRQAFAKVLAAEYRLILRSIATPGRLAGVGSLGAIAVLTAVIRHANSPYHALDAGSGFFNGLLASLIPVAILVFGAAALGDLIDDGSLVYLWLRPVPAWVHVAAAWLATVTIAAPLVLAPTILATAIIDASPGLMGGAVLSGLVAVFAYAALFVTAGIRFRRSLPWGIAYILIWEGFIARAGKGAAKLAVHTYTSSILSQETGVHIKLASLSLPVAVLVPLLVGTAALAYACRRIATADVA